MSLTTLMVSMIVIFSTLTFVQPGPHRQDSVHR
jgi:hypothetical protein